MRILTVKSCKDEIAFAEEAAKRFSEDTALTTYGSLQQGSYFALRWGMRDDCVLMLKLDKDYIPTVYSQIIT